MHQKVAIGYACGCHVVVCFDAEKGKDVVPYSKHPSPTMFFCTKHQGQIDLAKADMKEKGPQIMGPDD